MRRSFVDSPLKTGLRVLSWPRASLAALVFASAALITTSSHADNHGAGEGSAELQRQIEQLKTKLDATQRIAKESLTRSIQTTDDIVSGLSKELSAADNVPPETVGKLLDLALQIYSQAAKDIESSEILGAANLLQKLIGVDIKTSIALTKLDLGSYEDARVNFESAEVQRREICAQNNSLDCNLRRIRIASALASLALTWRPQTRDRLSAAYQSAEKNAIRVAESQRAQSFKLHDGDVPSSTRQHDLFLSYWQAQTTQAKILLRLATLRDAGIEPAQRRELLRIAGQRMTGCTVALKPPPGASEGNVDSILGRASKRPVNSDTQQQDAQSTTRAGCLIVASEIKTAFQSGQSATRVENLRVEAQRLADEAGTAIAGLAARSPRNLPVQKLNLETRIRQSLSNPIATNNARATLIDALREFTDLVANKNYQHAALEQSYLDHLDQVRALSRGDNTPGTNQRTLSLPRREQIAILRKGVQILVDRLKARSGAGRVIAADGGDGSPGRRDQELAALKASLSSNAFDLFALLNETKEHEAIAEEFDRIRAYLPQITDDVASDDTLFSQVLRVNFFAAIAYRDLDREAAAIDIFYDIERTVLPRIEAASTVSDTRTAQLLRHLHADAISELGGIKVVNIPDADKPDRSLKRAFELVDLAQKNDASNIEFRFALAAVLANQAERMVQRGQLEEASKKLERARKLGSDEAAKILISWARNGTGPDGRVDRERAELFSRERRENTPFRYDVRGTSQIFSEERTFTIYVAKVRGNIDTTIREEIERLREYYTAKDINETDIAKLRDIYLKARRSVGNGAIITNQDLITAKDRVAKELKLAQPYGDSRIAAALSRSDTLIEDGDFGRAVDSLDGARGTLPEQATTPADVHDWGLLGLHYLKLAEQNQQAERAKRNVDLRDLIDRAKEASNRALTRSTDLRLFREREEQKPETAALAQIRSAEILRSRLELHAKLADLATRAASMEGALRLSLSYETNKSFPLRFNEIARQYQSMAISQFEDHIAYANLKRNDILELVGARRAMAVYARRGAGIMENSNEALQSAQTRLFTLAMRQLSSSYRLVEELEKRNPENKLHNAQIRLGIQQDVARVHDSFQETKVALRLAREAIEDTQTQVKDYRDDTGLLTIKAENHELLAGIADKLAGARFKEMTTMLTLSGREISPEVVAEIKNLQGEIHPSIRTKLLEASKMFDLAREHFSEAVDIRERILAVEPDAFCGCKVNDNVRGLARMARFQEIYNLPRQARLPSTETSSREASSVQAYLSERIRRWRKRAGEDLNPDSTRFANWYLARALALRDDISRADATIASRRYEEADQAFRKISSPSNEMLADHALLLSDKAFHHLQSGPDGLLDAERAIGEAYEIWLRLPYSVWIDIEQSDLNIPANYAHFSNVRSRFSEERQNDFRRRAKEIYEKYRNYRLRMDGPATWESLLQDDIRILRQVDGYGELTLLTEAR